MAGRVGLNVFVVGATGYIGGSVAHLLLERGHGVRGLTRSRERAALLARLGITPVVGSLDDADLLTSEAQRADAVVNAADSDHHGAVRALLAGLEGSGKPFLHTSGSSIVGDNANGEVTDQVFTEDIMGGDGSWEPTADKAARVAIDREVVAAAHRGIRSVVLCNTLIYGHGRGLHAESIQVPLLVDLARRTGVARHIGRGRNVWSTVHVDDVADLYLLALDGAAAGSFYFVENGEARFDAIVAAIATALGLGAPEPLDITAAIAEWGHEPAVYALGSNSRVRGTRARRELSWNPQHSSVIDWITRELPPAPPDTP